MRSGAEGRLRGPRALAAGGNGARADELRGQPGLAEHRADHAELLPTASLIQHEWQTHGTCTGLSAADYFALVRKARDSVKIPGDFQAPAQAVTESPGQIEAAFAAANPNVPQQSIRTSCTGGALQDVRICFNKDLSPHACSASAGECPAPAIQVLPVK